MGMNRHHGVIHTCRMKQSMGGLYCTIIKTCYTRNILTALTSTEMTSAEVMQEQEDLFRWARESSVDSVTAGTHLHVGMER